MSYFSLRANFAIKICLNKKKKKHYRVKLDLDGPTKARYPRITKTATKRVSVLSLCCEQRQETFVNLGLFQTNTN